MAKFIMIILLVVFTATGSYGVLKSYYKLSASDLPADKNVFAEVDKDRGHYCKTHPIRSQSPSWETTCAVTHNADHIVVETRNDRKAVKDESLGFSEFYTNQFITGREIHQNIMKDNKLNGKMTLSVLKTCELGSRNC